MGELKGERTKGGLKYWVRREGWRHVYRRGGGDVGG